MDTPPNNRPLSEIGHLFLSSVREKQTGGTPRPQRIPPGGVRRDVSIDMTPDEFAKLQGETAPTPMPTKAQAAGKTSTWLTAVLGASRIEHAKDLARRMSAGHGRVGLIEVDASEFRVTCFDSAPYARSDEPGEQTETVETFEPRGMSEAIEELSWDVHRWLVVLPNPRSPEARAILRQINQWILLTTPDHDGVVACYRMLKGLAELGRPTLSLALINADPYQSNKVFEKLRGVCQQFLTWDMEREPTPVHVAHDHVAEHLVMSCRATRDKAQIASGTPWQVIEDFVGKITQAAPTVAIETSVEELELAAIEDVEDTEPEHVGDVVIPGESMKLAAEPIKLAVESIKLIPVEESTDSTTPTLEPEAAPAASVEADFPRIPIDVAHHATRQSVRETTAPERSVRDFSAPIISAATMRLTSQDAAPEIIEIPGSEASAATILSAILAQSNGELVECPIKAPACPEGRLAVTRERTLVLLAVAKTGLTELHAVSRALNWMTENRNLISMALPQFGIDAHALPCLRLLVDHADVSAELLQPLLQSSTVTIHTYRRLKWGGKTGLLVEAA